MASPRIEYAVLPAGDGPGQDRCFTADGLVVVLDGASAIDPVANPDATEYVDTLGPLLVEEIVSAPGTDLRDALAESIRLTAYELALVPGTSPSSTVSIVRWGEELVDVLVLGDSPVVVQLADGRNDTIVQHSQKHIAPELRRRYRERLAAGYGFDEVHRAILADIQRHEARVRNTPEGYWIASDDPRAAEHASTHAYERAGVMKVVLATDGVDVGPSWLEGDPHGCVNDVPEHDLTARLHRTHQWERVDDPDGQQRPRSKRHDDKAVAVVTA